MNAIEEETEIFEPSHITTGDSATSEACVPSEPREHETASSLDEAARAESPNDEADKPTRRKLEEQLEALKRKEVELRRALVMADHPALADSIRILQGRTYALERIEVKLALGLSKAELRRRETLQKKLASLTEKRTELSTQIGEVEAELDGLGVERQQGYEAERRQGLEQLLVALGTHDPALHAAGIEATELVPEIGRWLPEIETLAESLASKKTHAN